MPDASPAADAAATTAGVNAGAAVTLEQLAAIVAALQGSVETLTSQAGATQAFQTQIADGLKSLSENVNKLAVASATDSDSGYLVRSSVDPAAGHRRLETYAELALSGSVDFARAIQSEIVRKISVDTDHHQPHPATAPAGTAA